MNPDIVDLSIEELVLEGIAIDDGEKIKGAVQQELSRLLMERGVPQSYDQTHDMTQLNGGRINIAQNSDALSTGVQIARAIYRGMNE